MADLKTTLKQTKFVPSKKMGQNFLVDSNITQGIVDNLPDLKAYDCILEIGPGFGAITKHLVQLKKQIVCIELDKRLYDNLTQKFKNCSNLKLVNDDFLQLDLNKVLASFKKVIVIANIPYSITTPIILKALAFNKIKTLYIMVQKEVANKWIYKKTSNRNASTNIINYYFDFKKILDIKNTCFVPSPKVDSSMVLLIKKNNKKYDPKFYQFMRPFFLFKRKKILNNLPKNINKNAFINCLKSLGYDENIRAEVLNYTDWEKIYNTFK